MSDAAENERLWNQNGYLVAVMRDVQGLLAMRVKEPDEDDMMYVVAVLKEVDDCLDEIAPRVPGKAEQ